jgi:hypothetical protein
MGARTPQRCRNKRVARATHTTVQRWCIDFYVCDLTVKNARLAQAVGFWEVLRSLRPVHETADLRSRGLREPWLPACCVRTCQKDTPHPGSMRMSVEHAPALCWHWEPAVWPSPWPGGIYLTLLTVMVSPATLPFTVTFLPANETILS